MPNPPIIPWEDHPPWDNSRKLSSKPDDTINLYKLYSNWKSTRCVPKVMRITLPFGEWSFIWIAVLEYWNSGQSLHLVWTGRNLAACQSNFFCEMKIVILLWLFMTLLKLNCFVKIYVLLVKIKLGHNRSMSLVLILIWRKVTSQRRRFHFFWNTPCRSIELLDTGLGFWAKSAFKLLHEMTEKIYKFWIK